MNIAQLPIKEVQFKNRFRLEKCNKYWLRQQNQQAEIQVLASGLTQTITHEALP